MDFDEILRAMALEDGALIELYVFDTTPDHWRRVVEWLAAEGRVESLTRSGEPVSLESTSDLFVTEDAEFAMSVRIGRQLWTTSFYSPAEIDLQGDPNEVKSREDLEQIAAFMGDLNRLTGKRVVLVTETLAPRETTPYLSVG